MEKKAIAKAKALAKDFIDAVDDLTMAIKNSECTGRNGEVYTSNCPKESGHLRRKSMELTRALAEMRKP